MNVQIIDHTPTHTLHDAQTNKILMRGMRFLSEYVVCTCSLNNFDFIQATSIASCCEELEIHIARSCDFLRGGHARNSIAVLEVLTPPTVAWLVEQGNIEELEEEDKNTIQGFTALLVSKGIFQFTIHSLSHVYFLSQLRILDCCFAV
jgi:hypothetical protein